MKNLLKLSNFYFSLSYGYLKVHNKLSVISGLIV